MATGTVMLAGGLPGDVGEKEMSLTVEEYLTAQCKQRVGQLKRHVEGLVEGYMEQYKRARQTLSDAAAETLNNEAAADEAGSPVATAKPVRVCAHFRENPPRSTASTRTSTRICASQAQSPPSVWCTAPQRVVHCSPHCSPPLPPHPPPVSAR